MSGNNELDQIQKIHKILGTPPMQLLEKMKRQVNFCIHQHNLKVYLFFERYYQELTGGS